MVGIWYVLLVGAAILAAWLLAFGDKDRVGVAGALLGGIVGFAVAQIGEHRRRRDEDRHRFEADRRELYATFLERVRSLEAAIRARHKAIVLARVQPEQQVIPDDPDVWGLRQIVDEIEMLGPSSVWEASRNAKVALERLAESADEDDAAWEPASAELKRLRDFFLDAAKEDLVPLAPAASGWRALLKQALVAAKVSTGRRLPPAPARARAPACSAPPRRSGQAPCVDVAPGLPRVPAPRMKDLLLASLGGRSWQMAS